MKETNTMLKLKILAVTVIFVSGAKVGDEVKIRINTTRRNFGFADVVE